MQVDDIRTKQDNQTVQQNQFRLESACKSMTCGQETLNCATKSFFSGGRVHVDETRTGGLKQTIVVEKQLAK